MDKPPFITEDTRVPPPRPPLITLDPPQAPLNKEVAMVGCMEKPPVITTNATNPPPQPSLKPQLDPPQPPPATPQPQLGPPKPASSRISLKNKKIVDYFNKFIQEKSTCTTAAKYTPSLPPSLKTTPYTPSSSEATWSGKSDILSENFRDGHVIPSREAADANSIAAGNLTLAAAEVQYEEDDKKRTQINQDKIDIEQVNMNKNENEEKEYVKTIIKTIKNGSKNKMNTVKTKNKTISKKKTENTTKMTPSKLKNTPKTKKKAATENKIDKNARKLTEFWALKTENCSDPQNYTPDKSGIANPDLIFQDLGLLQNAKSGETLLQVKTVGSDTQPDKGINRGEFSDWPDGTRCDRSSQ